MANQNIILVDDYLDLENAEELNPATSAEQIEYNGVNVKQELKRIETIIEQYEN